MIDQTNNGTRWTLEQCYWSWEHGSLRLAGVPTDYSGFINLRDAVPFSDKTLAKKTKPLLSFSSEYAPRKVSIVNKPLNKEPVYPLWTYSRPQLPCQPFESDRVDDQNRKVKVRTTLPGMERFLNHV